MLAFLNIPLTILSLDTDETVRNLSIEFSVARLFLFLLIFKGQSVPKFTFVLEYNSAKEICKYPSFSKVGGNYPLDLKIIWSSAFRCEALSGNI
jgi:hypothetical protein